MMFIKVRGTGGALFGVIAAVAVTINVAIGVSWLVNAYKLVTCDWSESGSWKGEIVHGIGLIPGVSLFTVWNGDK